MKMSILHIWRNIPALFLNPRVNGFVLNYLMILKIYLFFYVLGNLLIRLLPHTQFGVLNEWKLLEIEKLFNK